MVSAFKSSRTFLIDPNQAEDVSQSKDFVFSNEFIRQIDKDIVCDGFNDYRIYYDNVLRNINFIDKLNTPLKQQVTITDPDNAD